MEFEESKFSKAPEEQDLREEQEIREQMEYGENVEVRAIFMRHAAKTDTRDVTGVAPLSEEGREQAREVGRGFVAKEHGIKAYMSPMGRAIETANLILEEQEKKGIRIFKSRIRAGLRGVLGSKEWTRELTRRTDENLPKNYEELTGEERQETLAKAEDIALDWWLSFGEKKFDEETPSPEQVAAGVALLVDTYIRMADRLYSKSKVHFLNATHKSATEPFLKEVLLRKVKDEEGNERIVRGFDRLEEIGGGLDLAEFWDITVTTDEKGAKIVKLHLRGQEYDIDRRRLDELAQFAREVEKRAKIMA